MQNTSRIERYPASPEYVLEVIRDSYRQQLQFDPEAEPDIDLTFNSSISEWRVACDLLSWKPLSKALNKIWQLDVIESEWKGLLEPPDNKTLFDLCSFIATHTTQPVIIPSHLLGATCHSGGTFLAIREILKDAGANVKALRPSSPVAPYLNDYFETFIGPISRLAPNTIPPITVYNGSAKVRFLTFFIGLIATSVLTNLGGFWIAAISGALTILCLVFIYFGPRPRAKFLGVSTFRDLVERIHDTNGFNPSTQPTKAKWPA